MLPPQQSPDYISMIVQNKWVIPAIIYFCLVCIHLTVLLVTFLNKFISKTAFDAAIQSVSNTAEGNNSNCLSQIRDLRRDTNELTKLLTLGNKEHYAEVKQIMDDHRQESKDSINKLTQIVGENTLEVASLKSALEQHQIKRVS